MGSEVATWSWSNCCGIVASGWVKIVKLTNYSAISCLHLFYLDLPKLLQTKLWFTKNMMKSSNLKGRHIALGLLHWLNKISETLWLLGLCPPPCGGCVIYQWECWERYNHKPSTFNWSNKISFNVSDDAHLNVFVADVDVNCIFRHIHLCLNWLF